MALMSFFSVYLYCYLLHNIFPFLSLRMLRHAAFFRIFPPGDSFLQYEDGSLPMQQIRQG